MLFIEYLLDLTLSFGTYIYDQTHHLVLTFEHHLYLWKDCPAYVCLVKDIAEAYSIELVFIVFLISFMTLISITVKSYVKLKGKFVVYRHQRANTATTSKKSRSFRFAHYLPPFKLF